MVEIELRGRRGELRGVALVDDEDAAAAQAHRWHLSNRGYAKRTVRHAAGCWETVLLHRALMGLERGDPREVDHENLDRLDCRRTNLRIATPALNAQNQATCGYHGAASKFRGVTRHRSRWMARAQYAGREHYLGLFDDELEAARAAAAFRAEHMPFSAEAA